MDSDKALMDLKWPELQLRRDEHTFKLVCICIMHRIYLRILFTRAPIDSRPLRSDGTILVLRLLFIF